MRQYMVGSRLHLSQKQDIPDVLMLFLLSSCVSGLHMLPQCIGAIQVPTIETLHVSMLCNLYIIGINTAVCCRWFTVLP